jgi:RNA polymerase sigma-70 factor (ECF subfamily)
MSDLEFSYKLIDLHDSLKKYAYNFTGNKELARDLVQETFLRALKNRDKFVLDTSLKAWTFTIMKNTFLNEYRRSTRQNIYRERNYESFFHINTNSFGFDDPSSAYLAKELTKSVDELDEPLKVPLMMRIKGYKYKEIAQELNLSMGTVKSRIFIARKQLMVKMSMS